MQSLIVTTRAFLEDGYSQLPQPTRVFAKNQEQSTDRPPYSGAHVIEIVAVAPTTAVCRCGFETCTISTSRIHSRSTPVPRERIVV